MKNTTSSNTGIYIASLEPFRSNELPLISELSNWLTDNGYQPYLMMSSTDSGISSNADCRANSFCTQQNETKLAASSHILMITGFLNWDFVTFVCENQWKNMYPDKQILYLVRDEVSCLPKFLAYHHLDENDPAAVDLLKRTVFMDDYQNKLIKLL